MHYAKIRGTTSGGGSGGPSGSGGGAGGGAGGGKKGDQVRVEFGVRVRRVGGVLTHFLIGFIRHAQRSRWKTSVSLWRIME